MQDLMPSEALRNTPTESIRQGVVLSANQRYLTGTACLWARAAPQNFVTRYCILEPLKLAYFTEVVCLKNPFKKNGLGPGQQKNTKNFGTPFISTAVTQIFMARRVPLPLAKTTAYFF